MIKAFLTSLTSSFLKKKIKPKRKKKRKSPKKKVGFCIQYDCGGADDFYDHKEKDRWDFEDIENIRETYEKDEKYYDDIGAL